MIDKLKFLLIIDKIDLINKNRSLSIFLTALVLLDVSSNNFSQKHDFNHFDLILF